MRTPLALAALLLLTACSSGGDGAQDTSLPGATPSAPAATVAVPTKVAAGATATSPAGTYRLDTSGTVTIGAGRPQDVSGTATLTVSPPKEGTQHTDLHSDQGDTEQDLLLRDTGTYAAGLKLSTPAFTKEFRPPKAVLLVPDPAEVGAAWPWSAVSTDGKTTARTGTRVLRTETLTIGGAKVPCVVLRTHLVLSGDLTYDAVVTTWFAPDKRLPVKDDSKGKGSFSSVAFSTDVTRLMRSVRPA